MALALTTTALLDDFNRADENPLSGGGRWAQLNSSSNPLQIISNATASVTSTNGTSYWTRDTFASTEVWARISSAQNFGVLLRLQDVGGANTWDGYELFANASNDTLDLRRVTNATTTSLVTRSVSAIAIGVGIMLRAYGTRLEAWYFKASVWTLVTSTDDSTYTSGNMGLRVGPTSPGIVTDFGGGQFVPDYANSPALLAGFGAC